MIDIGMHDAAYDYAWLAVVSLLLWTVAYVVPRGRARWAARRSRVSRQTGDTPTAS